jgi:hypothetical protein
MVTSYIMSAGAALAIAWLAAMLHLSGHAPLGLISLGVGAAVGAVLTAIAAMGYGPKSGRVAGRAPSRLTTVIFAIVTVLAQHAWLYLYFRRQWHEARANSAHIAMFRPESPWSPTEYLTRELTAQQANPGYIIALWALDAALIVAAAVAIVAWLHRRFEANSATADTDSF